MTPMSLKKPGFLVSTDKNLLQVARIHHFLSTQAYWSQEIPEAVVRKAIDHSLCFGLYAEEASGSLLQIGLARVITDTATFAWLCDVYVEPEYRGQGLSKWLIDCVMKHPELQNLRRFCLATKDAHSLYSRFGFEVTKIPERWMEIRDNDLYKKMKLGQ